MALLIACSSSPPPCAPFLSPPFFSLLMKRKRSLKHRGTLQKYGSLGSWKRIPRRREKKGGLFSRDLAKWYRKRGTRRRSEWRVVSLGIKFVSYCRIWEKFLTERKREGGQSREEYSSEDIKAQHRAWRLFTDVFDDVLLAAGASRVYALRSNKKWKESSQRQKSGSQEIVPFLV